LADRMWDLVDYMSREHFDAIVPRVSFEMSFGTGCELDQYRRILIEVAKVAMGNPNRRFYIPLSEKPYDSEYLQQLRRQHYEELKGRVDFNDPPLWARRLSICQRRMETVAG